MTSQADKAHLFRSLHVPGQPVILYNIWDAGSAILVARAGARAIATGSWSVAAAQGYEDGEALPLDALLAVVARISACVGLPLTIDFEGGYATGLDRLGANVERLLALGVAGLNFEDQVVNGPGLYPVGDQVERLRTVRRAADAVTGSAFINARTDVFLKAASGQDPATLLEEVLRRAAAYAAAGADGLFVPGLTDPTLIGRICRESRLPVNIMMPGSQADLPAAIRAAADLGVARISFGPAPYRQYAAVLEGAARTAFGEDR